VGARVGGARWVRGRMEWEWGGRRGREERGSGILGLIEHAVPEIPTLLAQRGDSTPNRHASQGQESPVGWGEGRARCARSGRAFCD
jgi:hypothetical protein